MSEAHESFAIKNQSPKSAFNFTEWCGDSKSFATYSNNPTEKHIRLYQRWASSGIGMIITGNIMIDRRALGEPGNVVIEDERDFEILKKWAKTVTEQVHNCGHN